jgi:preprotein translocase subunit SecG
MQTVVIVVHLMIVVVLIGAVLLQKSEGGGLGMGGGAGFMSSRGTANLLTRTTAILAVCFFATSLLLSWLASFNRAPASIVGPAPASQTQPAGGATPVAPPTSGGLLDTLKKADEQQNKAPAAPEAPKSQ